MRNISRLIAVGAAMSSTLASSFRVFDNTAYTNTSVGYGSTNINWIHAYVCNPLTEGGTIPSADVWKAIVLEWNVYPSYPLVLACEVLYFTSSSTAGLYLKVMSTLQTWAADVFPEGQIIGWYSLSRNTISSLYGHYQELIGNYSNHAFFPSAYTFSDSISTWNKSLTSVINVINTINDTLPIWPYIWPQYHGNYSFIPGDLWQQELELLEANRNLEGFVIWGGKNHAVCNDTYQATAALEPWLNITREYLDTLYGVYGGAARKVGAQLFN